MKQSIKLYGPALALAIIGALAMFKPAQAQQQRRLRPGVVIIQGQDSYDPNNYHFSVWYSSSGKNSPKIQPGADLAEALEELVEQGYTIRDTPGMTFMAIRE